MKYPIILVHGLALKELKIRKAFGRIEKILKDNGYIVYTSTQDAFGTISNNAIQLKEQILEILKIENVDKINIIAHSKGGLDSKYMIENLGMENNIASLTTLCTPFKGSLVASLLLKLPKFITHTLAFFINTYYKILKDKKPNALKVCQELQLVDNIEIETLKIPNNIYCQSYSTTLRNKRDDFLLSIPLMFSKHYEKVPTDGLVTQTSSRFGNYMGDFTTDSISHIHIVDFMANKKKKEKIYKFYVDLCIELEKLGF